MAIIESMRYPGAYIIFAHLQTFLTNPAFLTLITNRDRDSAPLTLITIDGIILSNLFGRIVINRQHFEKKLVNVRYWLALDNLFRPARTFDIRGPVVDSKFGSNMIPHKVHL